MNSKFHLYVSIIKSVIRIAGCVFALFFSNVIILAGFFLLAELLGIGEELGDER